MSNYPIKMMVDESGQPFIPAIHRDAFIGGIGVIGDVHGQVSSVDGALVFFDGIDGKHIKSIAGYTIGTDGTWTRLEIG